MVWLCPTRFAWMVWTQLLLQTLLRDPGFLDLTFTPLGNIFSKRLSWHCSWSASQQACLSLLGSLVPLPAFPQFPAETALSFLYHLSLLPVTSLRFLTVGPWIPSPRQRVILWLHLFFLQALTTWYINKMNWWILLLHQLEFMLDESGKFSVLIVPAFPLLEQGLRHSRHSLMNE